METESNETINNQAEILKTAKLVETHAKNLYETAVKEFWESTKKITK